MTKQYGTPGERVMSPDVCTSRKLSRCSIGAQALHDRIILQSDDQGRQAGEPALVKLACFPICKEATVAKVGAWLRELCGAGLVLWYDAEDDRVLQVTKWWLYQAGQRRAYPSRWPAPAGHEDRVYGLPKDDRPGTRELDTVGGAVPKIAGALTAECGELPADRGEVPASAGACAVACADANLPQPPPGAPPAAADVVPKKGPWKPKHEHTQRLADYLAKYIRNYKTDAKFDAKAVTTLRDIEAMLTVDRRDPVEVSKRIQFLFGGIYEPSPAFDWRRWILSAKKLREKYDQIDIEYQRAMAQSEAVA